MYVAVLPPRCLALFFAISIKRQMEMHDSKWLDTDRPFVPEGSMSGPSDEDGLAEGPRSAPRTRYRLNN